MGQGTDRVLARPLLGKVKLAGIVRTRTGLHIGASKEVLDIGALDLPVVREPVTQEPYIPGSSLKGKLRALTERQMPQAANGSGFFNRSIGDYVRIHVCNTTKAAMACQVCRLFGASGGQGPEQAGSNFPARLKVRDAYFTDYTRNQLEKADTGLLFTEIKFENALDRITAAANPRRIERVPPGCDFAFECIYDVEDPDHLQADLEQLVNALRLLEEDALGGHGSRGSGKVLFYVSTLVGRRVAAYRREEEGSIARAIALPSPRSAREAAEDLARLREAQARIGPIVDLFAQGRGGRP
jgi:CRISPR-associated protein Csm3